MAAPLPPFVPGKIGGHDIVALAPPGALPLHWQNDVTGTVQPAAHKFLGIGDPDAKMTPEELRILRDYMGNYCLAPWFQGEGLAELRRSIADVNTLDELWQWLHRSLDIGIDPM